MVEFTREAFWSWVLNSNLWSLPDLQILAGFLYVVTNHLWKLSLTIITGNAHRELASKRVCGWDAECWGCLWASWGHPWGRNPQQFVDRLLDAVYHTFSRIQVSLMPSKNPIYHFPSLFLLPSHSAHDSVLCIGWERKEPFGQCPAQLGKPSAHSQALTFSCRRNHWPRKITLGFKLCSLGGKMRQVKSNSSLYPLHCVQTWIFWF